MCGVPGQFYVTLPAATMTAECPCLECSPLPLSKRRPSSPSCASLLLCPPAGHRSSHRASLPLILHTLHSLGCPEMR